MGVAMSKHKEVVEDLLAACGVKIDGPDPWDVRVHDERVYAGILAQKNLGLGDAYVRGWWDCDALDELTYRILTAHLDERMMGGIGLFLPVIESLFLNKQSKDGATEVTERHYDLGNDLFFSFLDSRKQYSCACFDGTDDLDAAQIRKMELICRKLSISRSAPLSRA
jgi:cyclopropane-fatty-acyl-phospholipid synthase